MSGRYPTRRSGKKASSKSQLTQRAPKKGTKRTRSGASSVAENEEVVADRGTAGNKRNKSKEDYEEWEDEQEYPFKQQEDAFMECLDKVNRREVFQNRKIRRDPFEIYFEALKADRHERAHEIIKEIDRLLAGYLEEIETISRSTDRNLARMIFHELQKEWKEILAEIRKPMSPSQFAKSAAWTLDQSGPAAINCLIPASRSGIPISLLHPAFAKFKYILSQPLPFNSDAAGAMAVAWSLCMTMPEHFEDAAARKKILFTELRRLFAGRIFKPIRFGSAKPNGALVKPDGSPQVIVEINNEPGAGGDVYMRCAATFNAAAVHQIEDLGDGECAAFAVAIDGPYILISGGFKDKDDSTSTFEPLSYRCSMLPDDLNKRQDVLAKHLYALQASVKQLESSAQGNVSGCPRVYGSFQTIGDTTQPLEFISPYKPIGSHCELLFKGRTTINNNVEEILVKVARGGYGEEAHRAAAKEGFAPTLYGVAKVDGAPPAYLMEFLSEKKGWRPFQDATLRIRTPKQWQVLEGQIDKFLKFMRKNRLVHGDLRPNNILLRAEDDSVELRILDWDWADEYGSARYPLDLSPGAELPGSAGELIDIEHDVSTIHKYFKKAKDPLFGRSVIRETSAPLGCTPN